MEEEVFTISITVSQPAAKIDGTVEIVDDYGLSIVASQQGVELEGVSMSEISQTALIAFGQWYKGDPGQDGQDGVDGFSPVVTVTPTEDGHEVTITDADGDHTFDVNDGVGIPQTLSLAGNELTLSDGGGTVTLPDGLPSQTGNAGKFLTTDGTDASWEELQDTSFVCNFTITSIGETEQQITCDKSIAEIIAAAQSGKEVRGFAGNGSGSSTDFLVTMSAFEDHYVAFQSIIVVFGAHLVYFTGDDSTNTDVWSGGVFSYSEVAFSGDYQDLRNKPTLGTASELDVAESGNASTTQVVKGDDTRLSDSRNAADVYPWAKAATKPSYTASEVGALPDTTSIPTKTSDLTNDSGFITSANIPTNVSDLNNDAGYISNETDPTVPSWAKASTKPSYTASEVGAIASSEKGSNNGVAELDATGKVPSSQLPSYVDDVLEYASLSAFPTTGDSGKIYIALDTNKTYRWSGSAYVEISESLALGETSSTAYAGNKGKANADAIAAIKDGSTIDSFADVETALASKQDTIDSDHKLSADLIADGDNNKVFTSAEKTKLVGIESGAQVNVKPDWNATSGSASEILNKPTIPAAQVNADWNAVSGVSQILNKPTIPAAQVNSDWNSSSGVSQVLNKPTLGSAAAKNVPSTGDAASTEVVMGNDSRLTDARTPTTHTHTTSQITDFPTIPNELTDLSDVTVSSPASGEVLKHNGTNWENGNINYKDIAPLTSKTYTNILRNNKTYTSPYPNSYLYFGQVKPVDVDKPSMIAYHILAYAPSNSSFMLDAIVKYYFSSDGIYKASYVWNNLNSASYYPFGYHTLFRSNTKAISQSDGSYLGVYYGSSTSYGQSPDTVERTFVVDIVETENCTYSLLDNVVWFYDTASMPANLVPTSASTAYNTTNFTAVNTATTVGLQETGDANQNTIGYQLRTNSTTLTAADYFGRYRLLFTSADNTQWVPATTSTSTNATALRDVNQRKINPFGRIEYYSTTTVVQAGTSVNATYIWDQYVLTLGYSFNRTGAALVLPFPAPVYVKCAPQTDGSAIIDSTTPYVHSLPSTDDGKIYILLGHTYSATNIELVPHHPVYYHDGTGIKLWTGSTIPPAVSGTDDGTNWTSITIGDTTKAIPSGGGGGGLTDYNFTHISNTTVSTSSTTITFAANTRGSQMITVSDDISIAFVVNNDSDNYLWIENSDTTNNIDVTISSVTHNGNVVSNVRMPRDGIAVPAGGTCEIGIVCNTDGAFITSRDDLE